MSDTDQHEATPRAELERQIMDPNIPKNEREWWAAAEIERLTMLHDNAKHWEAQWLADNARLRAFIQGCSTCKEEWERIEARAALEPMP